MSGGFSNKPDSGLELTAEELLLVQTAADGVYLLRETTAPDATSGFGKLYVKSSDSSLYFKDDGGTEYNLLTNSIPTAITVANEATDTTCFPLFVTAATGDLGPKTNAGLTFNSNTGAFSSTILGSSSLTASELIATDANKNLVSLAVATYPSLTELSYLKDVTSAIQTQLNNKPDTLDEVGNPATSKTFSMGGNTVTWNFTNPIGGMIFNMTGGWSGHVLEVMDSSATPDGATGDHLLHMETSRLNVLPAYFVNNAVGGRALHAEGTTLLTGDTTIVGSLGATGSRVTKGWFTDGEFTNMPTVGGTSLSSTFAALTHASQHAVGGSDSVFPADPGADKFLKFNNTSNLIEWADAGAAGATTALDNLASVAINAALVLGTSDAFALGSTTKMWSDLFLADGGIINWNNGNATLTHSAGLLTSSVPLSLGVSNALTAGSIELGHASDTTITRVSAGVAAIEGKNIYMAGGTDVAVADGGTGKSSWTQYLLVYADTTTSLAQIPIGTDGQVLTSGGPGVAPAFETIAAGISALTQSLSIPNPTSTEDRTLMFTDRAITVTQVNSVLEGTTPFIGYVLKHSTDRSAVGTNIIMPKYSNSITTGVEVSTFGGYAVDLEASSNQYASIADASQTGLDLADDFTFEAYVRVESIGGTPKTILSKGRVYDTQAQMQYQFAVHTDGKLSLTTYTATTQATIYSTGVLTAGVDYYVAVAYDLSAGQAFFYINGVLDSSPTGGKTTMNNTAYPFYIGANFNNYGGIVENLFDGLVKNVAVFSDIRTAGEIVSDMGTLVGNEANLVAYWEFNNDYLDKTANNNDLTAANSPTFVVVSDATIPADSWIWVETMGESGTTDELAITMKYTVD